MSAVARRRFSPHRSAVDALDSDELADELLLVGPARADLERVGVVDVTVLGPRRHLVARGFEGARFRFSIVQVLVAGEREPRWIAPRRILGKLRELHHAGLGPAATRATTDQEFGSEPPAMAGDGGCFAAGAAGDASANPNGPSGAAIAPHATAIAPRAARLQRASERER